MASGHDQKAQREKHRMEKLRRQLQELQLDSARERDPIVPDSTSSLSDLGDQLIHAEDPPETKQVHEAVPLSRGSSMSPPPRSPSNARQTDILAVIAALEAADDTLPRVQSNLESSDVPSPSYTPPDKINYEDGVTIVAKPKAPDPDMMRITFDNYPDFVLTRNEIVRGGPKNSFLQQLNKPNQPANGQLLTISFRGNRSPHLFRIIHAFLQGQDVIPFNQEHEEMMLGHYSSLDEGYEQLYQEAKQFAIYALSDKVRDHQNHWASEHFRVYDAVTHCPLREGDLEKLARRIIKRPLQNSMMPRVIVIGASINFTLRFVEDRSALLEYSLVAPMSPLAVAFGKLYTCFTDTLPQQFVAEGFLTEEECQRVSLDVFFLGAPDKRSDHERVIKESHYTLKEFFLRLHPLHDHTGLPPQLADTYVRVSFSPENQKADEDNEKAHRPRAASRHSTTQSLVNYYLNIPYAKVSLRFAPATSISSQPDVTLEVIQTATREVLAMQLPEELLSQLE